MGSKSTTEVIYKSDPNIAALIQNYSQSNEELKKQIIDLTNKYNQELKDLHSEFGKKLKEAKDKVENEFKSKEIEKKERIKRKGGKGK